MKIYIKLIRKVKFILFLLLIIQLFPSKKEETEIKKASINDFLIKKDYQTFKNIFKCLIKNKMVISIFLCIIVPLLGVYNFKSINNKQTENNQDINNKIENYLHYDSIEAIFSEDSDENYKIRKKIANVLSKKKKIFFEKLGLSNSAKYLTRFLYLDRKFNTQYLTQDEKKESINCYNQFPEEIKNEIIDIINNEIYKKKTIK